MMVSHLDADHITGLLELVRKLRDAKDAMKPAPWKVKRFWLNAFEDTIADGGGASLAADLFAADGVAAVVAKHAQRRILPGRERMVVRGRSLRGVSIRAVESSVVLCGSLCPLW